MPPASSAPNSYRVEEMAYPSRTIAFQAAGMMTSIIEGLQAHNEIRYTPAFMYADPSRASLAFPLIYFNLSASVRSSTNKYLQCV
jgi:hypothetical protein